jgi:hypothetical protein
MTHLPARTSAAAILGALALAIAAPSPAAAQPQVPAAPTWYALPGVVPAGTTVVVRTRDGQSTKGRVSSLSDTAIVLEGGRVKSFPADTIATIEGQNRRSVMRAAGRGAGAGLMLALLLLIAAGPQDSLCSTPEECNSRGKDVYGTALALPVVGAGIGAAVGALIPGKPTLFYSRPGPAGVALAPIAGHGRRGAAVRVAF